MKQNSSNNLVVLGVILILFWGGFYFTRTQKIKQTTVAPTGREIINLITYTTLGYSVSIPETYTVSESLEHSEIVKQGNDSFASFCSKSETKLCPITIIVRPNSENMVVENWIITNTNKIGKNLFPVQNVIFNNYSAVLLDRGVGGNWYFMANNGFVYEIQVTNPQAVEVMAILDSFKFIK